MFLGYIIKIWDLGGRWNDLLRLKIYYFRHNKHFFKKSSPEDIYKIAFSEKVEGREREKRETERVKYDVKETHRLASSNWDRGRGSNL